MEAEWCAQVYRDAVDHYGAPQIMNTDQGSQFTSTVFTEAVIASGAKLSMDGTARANEKASSLGVINNLDVENKERKSSKKKKRSDDVDDFSYDLICLKDWGQYICD